MSLDLSAASAAHHPVKGGSSTSNIRGGYTGDWVICSCDPGNAWDNSATRIPIGEYPAHLLTAAAPLIEAQVRAQVARDIEASCGMAVAGLAVCSQHQESARIARGTP